MSRFVISSLRSGPDDLNAQLPVSGVTYDMRTGTDAQTYFYAQLDQPLKYRYGPELDTERCQPEDLGNDTAGPFVWVTGVVFRADTPGDQPHHGMRGFPVYLAYAIDPTYASDATLDPSKVADVAVVEIDDADEQQPADDDSPTGPVIIGPEHTTALTRPDPDPAVRPNEMSTPPDPAPPRGSPASQYRIGMISGLSPQGLQGHSRQGGNTGHRPPPPTTHPLMSPMLAGMSPRRPSRTKLIILATVIGVLVLVALALWGRSTSAESGVDTSTVSTQAPTTTTAASIEQQRIQKRLNELLPQGYPRRVCTQDNAAPSSTPTVTCGPNSDPGGPVSATYTLYRSQDALDEAFEKSIATAEQVNCPGDIQSPGPWRRNATPERIAGMLFCGIQDGRPAVTWTDNADRLLSVALAGDQGPTLEELYAWWSTHS